MRGPAIDAATMHRLRNDAPSHDFEYTRQAIRESFGKEIEEIFEAFAEKPIASGTIAQVSDPLLTRPDDASA
eukprot:813763-Rhodomonas_salina.1